jgi:DNA polymerase
MKETPQTVIDYECTECRLHKHRTNVVWGDGNHDAKIILVAEGPGRNEDEIGRAFAGLAGKTLDAFLNKVKLDRTKVLILNIVKCRPHDNRKPYNDEARICGGFLKKQLRVATEKKVIVALGATAWEWFFSEDKGLKITDNHGKVKRYKGIKVVLSMHPSFVRRKHDKSINKAFLSDLIKAKKIARR